MKASTSRTVSAKVLHSIVSVLLVFAMIFVFSHVNLTQSTQTKR